jgi:sugar lactone lactonase YvrE
LNILISFSQTLSFKWRTDSLFLKPESALYDSVNQIIYVSNINGKYLAKDSNGFISRLKINGEIDVLKWCTGLNNPQGMGLFKNRLYVADIDRIVLINTQTDKIEKTYEVKDAKFLNDITSDKNGDIYISDCRMNKIYKLTDDKLEVWSEDTLLAGPNGLLCNNENLFILNMKKANVFCANKIDKKLIQFCSGIKNCDGIVSDGQGGFFISGAWQGEIFHLTSNGIKDLVLDLGKDKIISADIEYIVKEKLLVIPTLNKTVIAYKWE